MSQWLEVLRDKDCVTNEIIPRDTDLTSEEIEVFRPLVTPLSASSCCELGVSWGTRGDVNLLASYGIIDSRDWYPHTELPVMISRAVNAAGKETDTFLRFTLEQVVRILTVMYDKRLSLYVSR